MSRKRDTEKNIRSMVRKYFKEINKKKECVFVLLLFVFTCILFYQPTFEKVIIYICSLISIQYVITSDEERKRKIKFAKKNVD